MPEITDPPTVARRLADWVTELTFDRLPFEVTDIARRLVLDQLGLQLRGATLPNVRPVLRLVRAGAGPGEATVTGHAIRTSAPQAAYANGAMGHSGEFDDAHMYAWHAGSAVVPAALATAETTGAGGREVIAAVVAGCQVMSLLGTVTTAMLRTGWHGSKVLGVFGAAAAAGKVLGLTPRQLTDAFGIAASDASGTMEYDRSGGEVKRLHAGSAARAGVEAALLAADGFTGPPTIIEGPRGVVRLFGETDDLDPLWRAWDRYQILDTMFRLYPAVGTVHAPLDAVRRLREEHGFAADDVAAIHVGLADWAVQHGASVTRPRDAVSAQFSLAFSVGLMLTRGHNRPQDYLDPCLWADPGILAVGDKVTPYAYSFEPGTPDLSAQVDVELTDGRVLSCFQRGFRGHSTDPATLQDVLAKYADLTDGVVPAETAAAIAGLVQRLEEVDDLTRLTKLLVTPGIG